MSAGRGEYPVREDMATDPRFQIAARTVGRALEGIGYPRINGYDRDELEAFLADFLYGRAAVVTAGPAVRKAS